MGNSFIGIDSQREFFNVNVVGKLLNLFQSPHLNSQMKKTFQKHVKTIISEASLHFYLKCLSKFSLKEIYQCIGVYTIWQVLFKLSVLECENFHKCGDCTIVRFVMLNYCDLGQGLDCVMWWVFLCYVMAQMYIWNWFALLL